MAGMFGRVINWLANEVCRRSLAPHVFRAPLHSTTAPLASFLPAAPLLRLSPPLPRLSIRRRSQVATKALVNNKTFQRFALKTVQNSQKVAKAVGEKTSQVKNSSVRCLAFSLSPLRTAWGNAYRGGAGADDPGQGDRDQGGAARDGGLGEGRPEQDRHEEVTELHERRGRVAGSCPTRQPLCRQKARSRCVCEHAIVCAVAAPVSAPAATLNRARAAGSAHAEAVARHGPVGVAMHVAEVGREPQRARR